MSSHSSSILQANPQSLSRLQSNETGRATRNHRRLLTSWRVLPAAKREFTTPILIGTLRAAYHVVLQHNNGHPDRNLT